MRKLVLCTLSAFFASILTGCATFMHPFGEDYLTLHGTPDAYETFFAGMDGLAQTAKGDPHTATNQARHLHDRQVTKREGLKIRLGGKHE